MKNLFIKTGTLAALSLASFTVLADTNSATNFASSNVYLGVEGGYDNTNAKTSAPGVASGTVNGYSLKGFTYGGFVGYQSPAWRQLNLGVEFFYDESNSEYKDTLSTPSISIKKLNDYGFSLLPGYLVSDNSKVYARLGYVNGKFRYSADVTSNQTTSGYQVGLGYLLGFAQNFGVRAEYDYSHFNSVNFTSTVNSQPSSNEFKLGLEWLLAL